MSKNLWIVLAVVVLGLGGWYATQSMDKTDTVTTQQTTTVTYQGEDGKSALELLRSHASVETTTDPSFGEYVTSINGVTSGTGGKYWLIFVNGQAATRGAAELTPTATDTVEWRLE
jgi:hypothetical protein